MIAAGLAFLILRWFAREVNARAGFFLVLVFTTTPLMALGSILMTVDPLSVLFWTAAMLAGWKAVQENGRTSDWIWVGVWMALGFLSKYTQLFQLLCWVVFFSLWAPARKHLARPGPWLALLINLLGTIPVLIWNNQNHWITVAHVAADAGLKNKWHPTLRFFIEFIGTEFALFNPVFFIAAVWACLAFWRRNRHNPRLVYFFSMGAPLFLCYLFYSFRSRILPNWIAPSLVPLFCLMAIYWDTRLRLGTRAPKAWLTVGLTLGLLAVIIFHFTDLLGGVWKTVAPLRKSIAATIKDENPLLNANLTAKTFPVQWDPHHRATGWKETAQAVNEKRMELLQEGKPVFIIADHYSLVGEITFYLPEAKSSYPDRTFIYFQTSAYPRNQLFFWPGYETRKGENAIFVTELDRQKPRAAKLPEVLAAQFESVTDMGVYNVMARGQLLRPLQFFACRNLR